MENKSKDVLRQMDVARAALVSERFEIPKIGRCYKFGDSSPYVGVTTILNWLSAKGLSNWRARNSLAAQEKASKHAREMGSKLDALFHDHLNGKTVEVPENCKKPFENFLGIVDKHRIKSLKTNYVVHSPSLGFAGEMDDLAYFEDELVVIDWKTGGKYNTVEPQMAAYKWAYEETHEAKISGTVCIVVHRDGTFNKVYKTVALAQTTHAFATTFDTMKYDCYYELKAMNWPWLDIWTTDVMDLRSKK